MRVFIPGVDGYLGWTLAQYLITRGHNVEQEPRITLQDLMNYRRSIEKKKRPLFLIFDGTAAEENQNNIGEKDK